MAASARACCGVRQSTQTAFSEEVLSDPIEFFGCSLCLRLSTALAHSECVVREQFSRPATRSIFFRDRWLGAQIFDNLVGREFESARRMRCARSKIAAAVQGVLLRRSSSVNLSSSRSLIVRWRRRSLPPVVHQMVQTRV